MILELVRRTIHLGDGDVEIFLVRPHLILEEGYRYRLSKEERAVRIATPVNSGMNAVSERDIVRKLVQFAIYGELAGTNIRLKVQAITGRNNGIGNCVTTVHEEL
jgi:hypothetical protein